MEAGWTGILKDGSPAGRGGFGQHLLRLPSSKLGQHLGSGKVANEGASGVCGGTTVLSANNCRLLCELPGGAAGGAGCPRPECQVSGSAHVEGGSFRNRGLLERSEADTGECERRAVWQAGEFSG